MTTITNSIRYYDHVILDTDRVNLLGWLADRNWQRSTVSKGGTGSFADEIRTSDTLYEHSFPPPVLAFLRGFAPWLDALTGRSAKTLEGWQAVRYGPGQKFEPHYDPGNNPGNERDLTVMLTLQAPDDGGHTLFLRHNYAVNSVAGRLLTWQNLLADGSIDTDSYHAGLPVVQGEKIILVNWYRQHS